MLWRRVAPVLVALVVVTGCAREGKAKTPSACLENQAVPTALAAAPGKVRFPDGHKLSDCLVKTSETSDLEQFSAAVLDEATLLRESARKDPGGPALVRFGYLHGALQRGADIGIHDELLRRFDTELLGVDTQSAAFRRGEAAGRSDG